MTTKTIEPPLLDVKTAEIKPESIQVNLAALIIRERKVKDEADRAGDDETFLASFNRLICLYESCARARGMIENGP